MKMLVRGRAAIGTINKAWAAAIAAPLAEWTVALAADLLWRKWQIAMPDTAAVAIVSLAVGLVVYHVPNVPAETPVDATDAAGA